MKWLTLIGTLSTAIAFYISNIDQRSEHAMALIEFESLYNIKIWLILSFMSAVFAILTLKGLKDRSSPSTQRHREDWPDRPPTTHKPQTKVHNKKKPPPQKAQTSMETALKNLKLPIGVKIKLAPEDRYPLRLQIERCTPEVTRKALSSFAQFIRQYPTPPAVQICFLEVIDSGIPYTNQVLGAFRSQYNAEEMMIRGYQSEVEVRFLCPDESWLEKE